MAKYALITGSSRGIGLALARELHSRGWNVIATCRDPAAISDEPFWKKLQLSIDSDESIAKTAAELKGQQIDLLINNAGIYSRGYESIRALDRQAMLNEFNIDSISPMMVIKALLPNLEMIRGTVVNISSLIGSIGDCQSVRGYPYRAAKAALNMYTKVSSIELKDTLRAVVAIHPGYVATDMTGNRGGISAEECAKAIVDTIENLDESQNGCLISRLGKIEPW